MSPLAQVLLGLVVYALGIGSLWASERRGDRPESMPLVILGFALVGVAAIVILKA